MDSNNVLKTKGLLKHKTITYKGLLVVTGTLLFAVLVFSLYTRPLSETYAPAMPAGNAGKKSPVNKHSVITDTATTAIERLLSTGKKTLSSITLTDSITPELRKNMYAYQIGAILNNEEEALNAFEKLYDVKDVYLVKTGRTKYYLLNYEGKTKDKLDAFLQYFKTLTPGRITVVNLMSLCPKEKALLIGEVLPVKNKGKYLRCLTCE